MINIASLFEKNKLKFVKSVEILCDISYHVTVSENDYSFYKSLYKERKRKMKYVVMVSHGEFAPGLHSAVKMMTGDRDDVLSTSLKDGMSADEFAANFEQLVSGFTAEDEVVLLADILSGSPFTNALNVLDQKGLMPNTLVIAGMNMPLAITAVLMKDNMPLDMLKETLLSEGRTGLTAYEPVVTSDDEDDI